MTEAERSLDDVQGAIRHQGHVLYAQINMNRPSAKPWKDLSEAKQREFSIIADIVHDARQDYFDHADRRRTEGSDGP